jgi:DoxX-like protein
MTHPFAAADSAASSKLANRAGWALTALFTLFMIFDIVIKLIRMTVVEDALGQLGYPSGIGFAIGVLEALLLALYLVPRTSVLGAVLLTGLFGGAIASHMRIESPLFSHVLFGVYLGLFAWGGLWLRDARLRALFPLRSETL